MEFAHLLFFFFFISMEVFGALEDRSKRSYTQKENRICPAVACDFRLDPVRVPGSLRIQPRCCSYAAACRCGNGKCWLLWDKGLDSSPRWKHPGKAKTWNSWRGKMNIHVFRYMCMCACDVVCRKGDSSSNPLHSYAIPLFLLLQLSLCHCLIINITALTPANEDEAGICIISPTWWTSPTPGPVTVSLVGLLNFTSRRLRTVR